MIDHLIDKQDNFEIIRDKIAVILASEVVNQKQLATDAGKDPNDWNLRIYTERSNPWEQFLNEQADKSPIVNVCFTQASFDKSSSNIVKRQKTEGLFNIDCYGYGVSSDQTTGHNPGDKDAAFKVHKALRLVRNILMSDQYTYLDLRGLVGQRWTKSIVVEQPQIDALQVQQIVGSRLVFGVLFNESSPQITPQTIESVSVEIKRASDGQVIVETEYNGN